MSTEGYRFVTLAEQPDLRGEISRVGGAGWPDFMLHSQVVDDLWSNIFDRHPECQFALLDGTTGTVVAIGNSMPVLWTGPLRKLPQGGVEWALKHRFAHPGEPPGPNMLCALQIVLTDAARGRHLSGEMVRQMARIGEGLGFSRLVAPVRPNWKHRYPLMPMEDYTAWQTDDGMPFDPWLRVHVRLGGRRLQVCSRSLVIEGTVSQWESWTGLRFPQSGDYVVPFALVPVHVDCEQDRVAYIEPDFWMIHEKSPATTGLDADRR